MPKAYQNIVSKYISNSIVFSGTPGRKGKQGKRAVLQTQSMYYI